MVTVISYTKSKIDTLLAALVPSTRTVAGHALSANVTVSKSDVGLGNADNTADLDKPLSTVDIAALAAKADLVSGKVPSSQLPALALTNVTVVANQAAMLAQSSSVVQIGDVTVISADPNKGSYMLSGDGNPATLANWILLTTPTDVVTSVAGHTGTVTLAKGDVGLGNVDNTADTAKPVSTAQQTALDAKLDDTQFMNGVTGIWKGTEAAYVALGSWTSTVIYVTTP